MANFGAGTTSAIGFTCCHYADMSWLHFTAGMKQTCIPSISSLATANLYNCVFVRQRRIWFLCTLHWLCMAVESIRNCHTYTCLYVCSKSLHACGSCVPRIKDVTFVICSWHSIKTIETRGVIMFSVTISRCRDGAPIQVAAWKIQPAEKVWEQERVYMPCHSNNPG